MGAHQRILPVRRDYNRWVANETLEDYALRFTAVGARRWSTLRVANTALGSISFLALEAIGGAITLTYGFQNALAAILTVSAVIFLLGLPISRYAARCGIDIDLLTRGAGFGYLGSTITSLIYASFTFIFFALEAAIMAKALELGLGVPESLGFVLSSVVVIPLVAYGFTFISRFQLWTQPLWVALHLLPFVFLAMAGDGAGEAWTHFTGRLGRVDGHFDLLLFGHASGVVFALVAQIGEQVDFLRFMPPAAKVGRRAWWTAVIAAGPGWIVLGALKMVAGSFLAFLAFRAGVPPFEAAEPTHMYQVAFTQVTGGPGAALAIAAVFVIVSQLKINVTNAYAGSIAWSNFFSRLTHRHPGRVVWVVFNTVIALLLMEIGVYRNLEAILGLYAHVAVAWVGAIVADLVINKPLGLSPPSVEFRRGHLFDVNPVGVGSMLASSVVSIVAYLGALGPLAAALSCYIGLACALAFAPLFAWLTKGRFYLARPVVAAEAGHAAVRQVCCVCSNPFEAPDMTHCPAYAGPICSLCCTLDARCGDLCKTGSRASQQVMSAIGSLLPGRALRWPNTSLVHYLGLLVVICAVLAGVLALVSWLTLADTGPPQALVQAAMLKAFICLLLISGVVCWLFVLAHESRIVAQEESSRQTRLLVQEIEAHEKTDRELQSAKEVAEAANLAKSRYLVGISHEFRTPLNAILGYAQLIERDELPQARRASAIRTIRRSGEHLAGLVDGLLDVAKIEAGRLQLSSDIVGLPEFLEQIADMFRLQAESKGVGFVYAPPVWLPQRVRTDEKRLRQILINLLSNAVKFTEHGEVRFTMAWRGDVAELIVEDTGLGIAEADLERIFVPFERIENPLGPWVPGTGLGLTITKFMTEVMGGAISVQSELGKGSRFTVRLYLPSQEGAALAPVEPGRVQGYEGPRIEVLVVDDQAEHRALMADLLVPLGFDVAQASHGAECLAILAERQPGLVLLDVTMPGMDGWEALQRMRGELRFGGPVLMMSAAAATERAARQIVFSPDGFVVKPFQVDALLDEIARVAGVVWRQRLQDVSPPAGDALLSASVREELAALCEIGFARPLAQRLAALRAERAGAPAPILDRLSGLVDLMKLDEALSLLRATLETTDDHSGA